MKRENALWRVVRLSWPLLGGAWGFWLGFGGHLAFAPNADSFGSVLALGFFVGFGLIGLVVGAASCALIGGIVNAMMQRCGVGVAGAAITATLLNAMVMWQMADLVQTRYPGLRADGPAKLHMGGKPDDRPPSVAPTVSSTTGASSRMTCSDPPPAQPKERNLWDAECR